MNYQWASASGTLFVRMLTVRRGIMIVFDVDNEKAKRATHFESGLSVTFLHWESGRDGSIFYTVEFLGETMPFSATFEGTRPHMEKLIPADRQFAFNEENEIRQRLDAQNRLVSTYSSEQVDPGIYKLVGRSRKMKKIFLEVWHALDSRRLNHEKKLRMILHSNSFIPDLEGEFGAEYEIFPL